MASKIHKERTGKGLKISEEIVSKEEMYEEEDDIPSFYRFAGNLPFPPRFQAYASLQSGLHNITAADANHQRVHSAFAQAFPHLNGAPQQNVYAQAAQSPMPLMTGNPTHIDTAFSSSQPVSPATASPAVMKQAPTYSPGGLAQHMPSPMVSVHSPLATPSSAGHTPGESSDHHGFFGPQTVVSSPMSRNNSGFPPLSPSGLPTPVPRTLSLSMGGDCRGSQAERGAVSATQPQFPWSTVPQTNAWGEITWSGAPVFDDASASFEPPAKRRRSQPCIRNHGHHHHTSLHAALNSMRDTLQYDNGTFTTKPPGSLQTLIHKPDGKSSALGFQQQPIVLQNPPPPRTRYSNPARGKIASGSPAETGSADASPAIPEVDEIVEGSVTAASGNISSPHVPDVDFAFNVIPDDSDQLVNQNSNVHDMSGDPEFTKMLEEHHATFQFDPFTHDGIDELGGSWDDFFTLPASQPENEES